MSNPLEPFIVLYDGECGICNRTREWAERIDRAGRLRFIASQAADLDTLTPGLTLEETTRAAYFVWPDGRRVGGARAIFQTLARLPGLWGVFGAVWALPPLWWIAEPFYRLVAHNRARISGWLGLSYCMVGNTPQRVTTEQKPVK